MSIEGDTSNLRAPAERNVYSKRESVRFLVFEAPAGRHVYRPTTCPSNPKPQRGDMCFSLQRSNMSIEAICPISALQRSAMCIKMTIPVGRASPVTGSPGLSRPQDRNFAALNCRSRFISRRRNSANSVMSSLSAFEYVSEISHHLYDIF